MTPQLSPLSVPGSNGAALRTAVRLGPLSGQTSAFFDDPRVRHAQVGTTPDGSVAFFCTGAPLAAGDAPHSVFFEAHHFHGVRSTADDPAVLGRLTLTHGRTRAGSAAPVAQLTLALHLAHPAPRTVLLTRIVIPIGWGPRRIIERDDDWGRSTRPETLFVGGEFVQVPLASADPDMDGPAAPRSGWLRLAFGGEVNARPGFYAAIHLRVRPAGRAPALAGQPGGLAA